jgi:hypothetical protein
VSSPAYLITLPDARKGRQIVPVRLRLADRGWEGREVGSIPTLRASGRQMVRRGCAVKVRGNPVTAPTIARKRIRAARLLERRGGTL